MNTMLIDSITAEEIEKDLPGDRSLSRLADFFASLSDVTRLKILSVLSQSTLCVTDIAALTSLNQTTVSHQLRTLKGVGIVTSKRQGKVMFYSLADRGFSNIMELAVSAVFERETV